MSDQDKRLVEFEKLNFLGKAVFITGSTFRIVGSVLESVVETVTGLVSEAERAFRQGLDSDVQDATILEEKQAESNKGTDR